MRKLAFIESIKILDGKIYNLDLHQQRMESTIQFHFGNTVYPRLREAVRIPSAYKFGLIKCRVLYAETIISIEYQNYSFRSISNLRLVDCDTIDYRFKSDDRSAINQLIKSDEEILIVKNKLITDTSFSNIVFENSEGLYTPRNYLLPGVKRKQLLELGKIKERDIRVDNMNEYTKAYLINAMIDIEDNVSIDISKIF